MITEKEMQELTTKRKEKLKTGKYFYIAGGIMFALGGLSALLGFEGLASIGGLSGMILPIIGYAIRSSAPDMDQILQEKRKQEENLAQQKKNEELRPIIDKNWPEQNILAVCIEKGGNKNGWMPLFRVSLVAEKGELRLKAFALGNSESAFFPVRESNGNLYVLESGDFYPLTKEEVNTKSAVFVFCGEGSGLSIIPKAYENLFSGKVLAAIQCGEKPINEVPADLLAIMPYFSFQFDRSSVTTNYKLGQAIVDNYFCAVKGTSGDALMANRLIYDYYKANGLPQFSQHDIVHRGDLLELEISRLDLAVTQYANARGIHENVPDIGGDPSMVVTQLNACHSVFAKLVSLEKTDKYVFYVSRCKVNEGVFFELVNTLNVIGNASVKFRVIVGLTEKGNIIIGMDDHLFVAASATIADEDFGKWYSNSDMYPTNHSNLKQRAKG